MKIKRAQKLAVFLHFESSSVYEAKKRLSIKRLRSKDEGGGGVEKNKTTKRSDIIDQNPKMGMTDRLQVCWLVQKQKGLI